MKKMTKMMKTTKKVKRNKILFKGVKITKIKKNNRMGVNNSTHYDTVKIIDVINEYTLLLEINDGNNGNNGNESINVNESINGSDRNDTKKEIMVTLTGIRPYNLNDVNESRNSRRAICILSTIKNVNTSYSADILEDQCVLYDTKNNIVINDWLITRGHVKPDDKWLRSKI